MSSNLYKSLLSGTLWTLIGQFGYLGITLIANIILARILSPEEFGQLGIVFFFIVISRVLTESGLGGALIRNNNATNIDFSTIFIFNLAVSVFLCLLLIVSSGIIADFYDDQSLKNLLIASSFILIINAFQFVQNVKITRSMRFKQKSIYEFFAILTSASISIYLALQGLGVWSLVAMQLITAFNITVLFWFFEGGHGKLIFNKASFKYHYKFGINTTIASILNSVFDNIYQVILAKYFTITQTGLYYQAKKLQDVPVGIINKLTQSVLFSFLSKSQEDKEMFKKTYEQTVRLFTVVSGLVAVLLYTFAYDIILLVLGKQWVSATFFLEIFSIVGFFYLQEMFNRILFKIYNDTKYILYLEVIKKIIQIISIIVGLVWNNLSLLMYGFVLTSVLSYLINFSYTNKKYTFIGNKELISVIKVILIGLLLSFLNEYIYKFNFLFDILITILSYLVLVIIFKLFSINEIKNLRRIR